MSKRSTGRQTVFLLGSGDSTLRARMLGDTLLRKREQAGLTQRKASKEVHRTPSTLSRWESGDLIPSPPELLYLLTRVYGASNAAADEIIQLAKQASEREADSLPMKVADYGWLESRATKIDSFEDVVVPLLLQTEPYARAIVEAWNPDLTKEQVERLVAQRMTRQRERFANGQDLKLSAVLCEGVLRRAIGGPEVMRNQLRHLLDLAWLPNVDLRLLPDAAGAHAGLTGSFTILHFAGSHHRTLAWVATRGGDIYFEDPMPFQKAFRRIKTASFPHRKSVDTIAAMSKETTA